MKYVFLVILITYFQWSSAQASNNSQTDFTAIDSFAQNAPNGVDRDSATIATYLLKGCHNDMEKARAVFTWIAYNIKYDDNAYNTGKVGNMSATGVIKRKHAVCEGFANLYYELATSMGLETQIITGWAKAYGYRPGEKFTGTQPNHAWNAVKVNGRWLLLDNTWGASYAVGGRGHLMSRKVFNPYWFNVDPYEFLFMHYPQQDQWQQIVQPVTIKQYEEMPLLNPAMFQFGFSAHDILDKSLAKTLPKQLPDVFPSKHQLKLVDFPLNGVLEPAAEATFTIICNEDVEIVFANDPKVLNPMVKLGNTYTVKMPLKRGELQVAIKRGKSRDYEDVIRYKVK